MLQVLQRFAVLAAASALLLAGCASQPRPPAVDPDAVRAKIRGLMPVTVANTEGWAVDIFAAFEVLGVPVTTEHICGVLAVIGPGIELSGGPPGVRPSRHRASRN